MSEKKSPVPPLAMTAVVVEAAKETALSVMMVVAALERRPRLRRKKLQIKTNRSENEKTVFLEK